MRKAKIICTLGPACDGEDVLEAMVRAGMDVARVNFSHGTQAEHRERIERLRRVAARVGRPVAVLQDIQGPKIRLGRFEGGLLEVKAGARVTLTTRPVLGQAQGRGALIPTPVRTLPKDVKKGDPILLDDGRVRLTVLSVKGTEVSARVEIGGVLKDRKGLNLPGAAVSVPTVTPKDRLDLAFGREVGVDYVALSFVRTAEDVRRARKLVPGTPLIAKIEKPQAVDNLAEIADAADGVMVARGDLGVEMPLEQLPSLQKAMVSAVNRKGGIVIVATEMLESMVASPRPTRAEVSDVANAVLDGADAVMLSGETASGRHPVEAVRTMARVVEETETRAPRSAVDYNPFERSDEISAGVAAAAVAAADQLRAGALVAYTERGLTARLVSEYRPRAPILGLSPSAETVRRMSLYWGVDGRQTARCSSTDEMLAQVRALCREGKVCPAGSTIVIVAGVPLNEPGRTNMMTVHRI
jgi:pyruvate kinase